MTGYILIAVLVLFAISEVFNRRERAKLLNRVMARDYAQFQYYETKFKKDVAEVEAVREESREERKEAKKEAEEEDDPDSLY
jgi:hypothetical protein